MLFWNQDKLQIVIETKSLRDLIDYQSAMIKLIHDMAHYSHDQGTHEDFPIHLSHACTLLESMLLDYDALATISNTIQEKRSPIEIQVANLEKELATLKAQLHRKRDRFLAEKE